MNPFSSNNEELLRLVEEWEPKLLALPMDAITEKNNSKYCAIKMVFSHLVNPVSNNTHRIIFLKYQPTPLFFPDHENLGERPMD